MKWSDGQTYSARVLGQHSAPLYAVSTSRTHCVVVTVYQSCAGLQVECSDGVKVQLTDEHIYSAREKLPRALQNKIKVSLQ